MRFFRRFKSPIQKIGGAGEVVVPGDTVHLILRDNPRSVVPVTVAVVSHGGTRIGWDVSSAPADLSPTSAANATAAAADDATGNALANALKADYNKIYADTALIFGAPSLGEMTAAIVSTPDATEDLSRMALANELRTQMMALAVDLTAAEAVFPGTVPAPGDFSPVATDDPTTQTLLNNLKAQYNIMFTYVDTTYTVFETAGIYSPRSEDVIGVDGSNQIACNDTPNIHDTFAEADTFPPVVCPSH